MTIHQLEVFIAIAEASSFTETAEKLQIPKPSLPLLVQSLEREFKTKLIERLGNKISITAAGKTFMQYAKEMVDMVEALKEEIEENNGLKKGKITVGSTSLALNLFLLDAIQKFKEEHTEVDLILKVQRSASSEQMLLDRELDLAILGRTPSSSFIFAEPYFHDQIVVIAPPNHSMAKGRCVPLEMIAQEPLITLQEGADVRDQVEQVFTERGLPFVPMLEIEADCVGWDAVKNAVARGLGIGFVSKSHIVKDIEAGHLEMLQVSEFPLPRTMYIAFHKNMQCSVFTNAFIQLLKRDHPYLSLEPLRA